jgi:hypothetical protein
MECTIKRKRNISTPGLDKLLYPIFKYDRKTTEMLSSIMKMILKTQKCHRELKEGTVAILFKPCSEKGKLKPENWRTMILTNTIYMIIFWKNCRLPSRVT